MVQMLIRPALAALASFALLESAGADVTVLGKPGLGSFATIQAAIDAASDGDVLLIAAGTYGAGFTIDGKSLTLLGSVSVTVTAGCEVKNLGSAGSVALVQLEIHRPQGFGSGADLAALTLSDNAGVVRVQDCSLRGAIADEFGSDAAGPGAVLSNCPKVMLVRSALSGGDSPVQSDPGMQAIAGGDGLLALDSSVAVYDCAFEGGDGSNLSFDGGDGGAGARVQGWGMFASGSTFAGGNGGEADFIGCSHGGDGGDGVFVEGAQLKSIDSTMIGGSHGPFGICSPGVDGVPIEQTNAAVTLLPGKSRELACANRVADGSTIPLIFGGEAGDQVWLLTGRRPTFLLTAMIGIAAVPMPWKITVQPIGVIGSNGVLHKSMTIASYAGPLAGWTTFMQPLCIAATGASYLGTPMQVLVENL